MLSYAEDFTLTCPNCQEEFHAEIWVLIDGQERSDLLDLISQGQLHQARCSCCGKNHAVESPLLLYRAWEGAPLIFSPGEDASEEECESFLAGLLGLLRRRLPKHVSPAFLDDDVLGIPRPQLAGWLQGGDEIPLLTELALHPQGLEALETREDIEPEIPLPKLAPPAQSYTNMLKILAEFIQTASWEEAWEVAEQYPQWLTASGVICLDELLKTARAQKDLETIVFLDFYRKLFKRIESVGILRATLECKLAEAKKGQNHQEGTEAQRGVEEFGSKSIATATLLHELAKAGDDGEAELCILVCQVTLTQISYEQDLLLWGHLHETMTTALLASREGSQEERYDQAIEYCRVAVDAAIQGHEDLATIARRQRRLGQLHSYCQHGDVAFHQIQAINAFKLALQGYTKDLYPDEWVSLQEHLGRLYEQQFSEDNDESIEYAIRHYRNALTVYTPEKNARAWGTLHKQLMELYSQRGQGENQENQQAMVHHGQQALKGYTAQHFPHEWAALHYRLGQIYHALDDESKVIYHWKESLKVYQNEVFPSQWALIHYQLALLYQRRYHGKASENLLQAIELFESALIVYSQGHYENQRLLTHYHLGLCYFQQEEGNRHHHLEKAIDHWTEAVESTAATTLLPRQRSQAYAYLTQAYWARIQIERDPTSSALQQMIACGEKAIEGMARDDVPQIWAGVHYCLAIAHLFQFYPQRKQNPQEVSLTVLEKIRHHAQSALSVYNRSRSPRECADLYYCMAEIILPLYQEDTPSPNVTTLQQWIEWAKWARDSTLYQAWEMLEEHLDQLSGYAYHQRTLHDNGHHEQEAIACYQKALQKNSLEDVQRWLITLAIADLYARQNHWAMVYHTLESIVALSLPERPSFSAFSSVIESTSRLSWLYTQVVHYLVGQNQLEQALSYCLGGLYWQEEKSSSMDGGSLWQTDLTIPSLSSLQENFLNSLPELAIFVVGTPLLDGETILWIGDYDATSRSISRLSYVRLEDVKHKLVVEIGVVETAHDWLQQSQEFPEKWQIVLDTWMERLWESVMQLLYQADHDHSPEQANWYWLLPATYWEEFPFLTGWFNSSSSEGFMIHPVVRQIAPSYRYTILSHKKEKPPSVLVLTDSHYPLTEIEGSMIAHQSKRGRCTCDVFDIRTLSYEMLFNKFEERSHLHFACETLLDPAGNIVIPCKGDKPFDLDQWIQQAKKQKILTLVSYGLPTLLTGSTTTTLNLATHTSLAVIPWFEAGASWVMQSLWRPHTLAPLILWSRFYRELFIQQLSPAQALYQSQQWLSHLTGAFLENDYDSQDDLAAQLAPYRDAPFMSHLWEEFTHHLDIPFQHPYEWLGVQCWKQLINPEDP